MTRSKGLRHTRSTPVIEPLEGRQLLSFYTGPAMIRPVIAGGAIYQLQVTGGGMVRTGFNHNGLKVNLLGTNASSTLSINLLRNLPHSRQEPLNISAIDVESGQLGSIQAASTANLVGPVTPLGNVNSIAFNAITGNAQINVAGDLGQLTAGSIALGPNADINVGGSLTGALNAGTIALNGGTISIGVDAAGPIQATSIALSHNGTISVGRDVLGGINVADNVTLDTGGIINVGRELDGLTIGGNLVASASGGAVNVGGDLQNLTIGGVFEGNGTSRPDLNVGLSLTNLTVEGGSANSGGIEHASITVAKDIDGFNVVHGVFNSLISAGVTINGESGPGQNTNIGPDGTDAIFDSQITAGDSIVDFLVGGDVVSQFVTNPAATGYPTRIIAGVTPQGVFVPNGLIDNFQITGSMTDSVLAASVAPYGGDGSLPATGYNSVVTTPVPPNNGTPETYNKPAGVQIGGVVGATVSYPNYSNLSYFNQTLIGLAWDPSNPSLTNDILPGGSINPSFASSPLPAASLTPGTILPLPTISTVLGGVYSTPHGNSQDYAGIFAANTTGVFVGGLPGS